MARSDRRSNRTNPCPSKTLGRFQNLPRSMGHTCYPHPRSRCTHLPFLHGKAVAGSSVVCQLRGDVLAEHIPTGFCCSCRQRRFQLQYDGSVSVSHPPSTATFDSVNRRSSLYTRLQVPRPSRPATPAPSPASQGTVPPGDLAHTVAQKTVPMFDCFEEIDVV
jgi:hypothetical protein